MSQDGEKYLYFNVALLKNSSTMEALWQDALKYHMIDQPGKLIAIRLTEYYEMVAQGMLHPGPSVAIAPAHKVTDNGKQSMVSASSPTMNGRSHSSHDEGIVTASPDAEQNADEAADYWASL